MCESERNQLIENLNNITNLINLEKLSTDQELEFIILYHKTLNTLKLELSNHSKSIKEYYLSKNLSTKEINDLISVEDKINLNFSWNKQFNFSCRYVKLSTNEEDSLLSLSDLEFIKELKKQMQMNKGIKIMDFRCRYNREYYIKIINTINLLSQLQYNNISLK
jgi:hypothetical protein